VGFHLGTTDFLSIGTASSSTGPASPDGGLRWNVSNATAFGEAYAAHAASALDACHGGGWAFMTFAYACGNGSEAGSSRAHWLPGAPVGCVPSALGGFRDAAQAATCTPAPSPPGGGGAGAAGPSGSGSDGAAPPSVQDARFFGLFLMNASTATAGAAGGDAEGSVGVVQATVDALQNNVLTDAELFEELVRRGFTVTPATSPTPPPPPSPAPAPPPPPPPPLPAAAGATENVNAELVALSTGLALFLAAAAALLLLFVRAYRRAGTGTVREACSQVARCLGGLCRGGAGAGGGGGGGGGGIELGKHSTHRTLEAGGGGGGGGDLGGDCGGGRGRTETGHSRALSGVQMEVVCCARGVGPISLSALSRLSPKTGGAGDGNRCDHRLQVHHAGPGRGGRRRGPGW
jgi:hypothetical protein